VLLYDLTSTYFEGGMEECDKAKRGYSRDSRPDCWPWGFRYASTYPLTSRDAGDACGQW
jgi:hypothetical protein